MNRTMSFEFERVVDPRRLQALLIAGSMSIGTIMVREWTEDGEEFAAFLLSPSPGEPVYGFYAPMSLKPEGEMVITNDWRTAPFVRVPPWPRRFGEKKPLIVENEAEEPAPDEHESY